MKKNILIISDSKTFLMYLGLLLKRFEFRVMVAEKKEAAYKFLKQFNPDLILLDAQIKTASADSVIKYLKKDKRTSKIPLIIVSNDRSSKTVIKYMDLGCYEYFSKPVKIGRLHTVLQDCFFLQHGTNRRHLRTAFNCKVTIAHNGIRHRLYTETLSEGGMYVWKKEPLREGTEVDVTLPLKDRKYLRMKGTVIYMKKLFSDFFEPPPGMAIEFRDLTDKASDALQRYLLDLIAEDILTNQEEPVIAR